MNLGIFTGNLGRDAQLNTNNGLDVLNFSVGVRVGTKDQPETMWVSCALWGKRAKSLEQYLLKGTRVEVSGQIKLRNYQKKDGTQGTDLTMNVVDIDFFNPQQASDEQRPAKQSQPKAAAPGEKEFDEFEDDIPF